MRGIRGHIWGILTMGWLSCAIGLAQSSFVSEITVPGYGKAWVVAFIPPRYWPANYIDALLMVNDTSSPPNWKLLGVRFALDGTPIDALWIGEPIQGYGPPGHIGKVEPLPDGKLMIFAHNWVGVIDPENPSSRWARRIGGHTATVGRDSTGNPVIAVLRWVGSFSPSGWLVGIMNTAGNLIRVFRLPAVSFSGIGNFHNLTMYHTACCRTSTQILAYDPVGNHFILASSSNRRGEGIIVYAFTDTGTIRWISGILGSYGDSGCSGGDSLGTLPLGDGTILVYSTCYDSIFLYRINTNTGRLVETPAVLLGGDGAIRVYPMLTMNYGSLLGYVSSWSGNFGTLFTDWSGWKLRVPNAKLLAMATTTATSPVRRLWVLGGSDSRDDNPAALLAFIDIDSWAEYPFGFYPCFETLLPAAPHPLEAVLNEVTTGSVQPVDMSIEPADFPLTTAQVQATQRCTVCIPSNGDVNGDGCIDDADLLAVLFAFGSEGPNPADVNCDGVVDDADLLIVLFNFGTGC